jgi:hypothetical protein
MIPYMCEFGTRIRGQSWEDSGVCDFACPAWALQGMKTSPGRSGCFNDLEGGRKTLIETPMFGGYDTRI